MKALQSRVIRLEARRPDDLAVLSDGELVARLVDTCGHIEALGGLLPDDWRGMIDRQDYLPLTRTEIAA